MYLLLARHGESVDDLTNQYGGWADFPLTPTGYKQLEQTSNKILLLLQKYNIKFSEVITSPLVRAVESGRVIANALSIPQKELLYLKEKNGYGLLTGLNKDFAKKNYPNLVKSLDAGYVYGAEPHNKFIERVVLGFKELIKNGQNKIAVSHGGYLGTFTKQILGQKLAKAGDGGFMLLEIKELEKIMSLLDKPSTHHAKDMNQYIQVLETFEFKIE